MRRRICKKTLNYNDTFTLVIYKNTTLNSSSVSLWLFININKVTKLPLSQNDKNNLSSSYICSSMAEKISTRCLTSHQQKNRHREENGSHWWVSSSQQGFLRFSLKKCFHFFHFFHFIFFFYQPILISW